jgi:hypothetical protein
VMETIMHKEQELIFNQQDVLEKHQNRGESMMKMLQKAGRLYR